MPDQPNTPDLLKQAIASEYNPLASGLWQNAVVTREIDWASLAMKAFESGLAPLLYSAIKRSSTPVIPDEVHSQLRQSYQETAAFNLLAFSYLKELQLEATRSGIQLVLLKGAALLHPVYGSIALRPMIDLDLLINYEELDLLRDLLLKLSFREQDPTPSSNPSGLFWNESLFVGPDPGKVQVEVHWHLIDIPYYARKLPANLLMERSIPVVIDGHVFQIPAADDQIIHLSIHNTFHHLNRLDRTLVDIAYIIHKQGNDLDWNRLTDTIRSGDVIGAVGTNIALAAKEWYAPVPESISSEFTDLHLPVRDRFFMLCQRSEFLKVGRTWLTLPGISLKIHFIKVQLFPDRSYLNWRYGEGTGDPWILLTLRRFTSGLASFLTELSRKFWRRAKDQKKST